MGLLILFLFFFCFMLNSWAVYSNTHIVERLTKPSCILLLLLYVVQLPAPHGLLVLALFFSLVGDLFLLRADKYFKQGLVSFLLAQVSYIYIFGISYQSLLFTLGILILCSYFLLKMVTVGGKKMKTAILCYFVIISIMVGASFASGDKASALGGLLFGVSDLILGWGRFVKREYTKTWRTANMVTYHLAQVFLTLSITGHVR